MPIRQHPRQGGPNETPHYGQAVNRWGVENLDNYDAEGIFRSERFQRMERAQQYYRGSQHDYKMYSWSGDTVPRGIPGVQPLTSSRETSNEYITLDKRRPPAPYRLARKIVDSYTGLIIGEEVKFVSTDQAAEDYARELAKQAQYHARQNQARNMGGACGSVGLSWVFVNGMPRIRVHSGKYIHILEWDDPEIFTVAHVTELYQTYAQAYDEKEKKYVSKLHWIRRDWTPTADIVFEPKVIDDERPEWQVNAEETVVHGDGYAHFIWILNSPPIDPGVYDGEPDYGGQYDQLDTLDIANSVTVYGGVRNLDPTLVLKLDEETGGTVRKGSNNALLVGLSGDAKYLELAGSAIVAGLAMTAEQRRQVLETASCVVPDENAVTGAGTSSLTLKVLYGPMTNHGAILRGQYGPGFAAVLNQMLNSARKLAGAAEDITEDVTGGEADAVGDGVETDEGRGDEQTAEPAEMEASSAENFDTTAAGAKASEQLGQVTDTVGWNYAVPSDGDLKAEPPGKMQRAYFVALAPRLDTEVELDAMGEPTGEETSTEVERTPGTGSVETEWPPFFPPTVNDDEAEARASTSAVAGKAVVSQQSAVERYARRMGLDPTLEWTRVLEEQDRATAAATAGMFPEAGGPVSNIDAPPDGIPSAATAQGATATPEVESAQGEGEAANASEEPA